MADNTDEWYFTRQEIEENSPSRRDGVSLKEENQLRKKCSRFISETCQKFEIPKIVNATANLFCQRFFLQRSLAKHKWYRIAIACVFLASKVEDHRIWIADFKEEGWRETLKEVFKEEIPYKEHKKMIREDEEEILAAINFGISVDHPDKYFVKVVRKLQGVPKEVCQAASEFIDNSYFSSLCLQFKPHKIAGAAFHLSYKFLKLQLPFQEEEEGYREFFQMTLNELEDISSQMMDLYEYRQPPHAAPDDQSASSSSSSSLPGDQSLSASASTSAPPPLPAAHGNQSPPSQAAPSKRSLTVLIPRPPAPGKESFKELMPPPRAYDKQSMPHLPSAGGEQSLPASSLLPAEPSNQNPPKPAGKPKIRLSFGRKQTQPVVTGNQMQPPSAVPCIQIPPPPAVPLQSPVAPDHQSLSPPAENPKENSPASSPSTASPGSQNLPPKLPAPVAPDDQSPNVTKILQYYRRIKTQPTAPGNQNPPPPVAPGNQKPPPPVAPSKQSQPSPSSPPTGPGNQSMPVQPLPPAAPCNQILPPSVAPCKQSPSAPPPEPAVPGNQSQHPPTEPGNQSPPAPVAPSNQSPSTPAAASKQSP